MRIRGLVLGSVIHALVAAGCGGQPTSPPAPAAAPAPEPLAASSTRPDERASDHRIEGEVAPAHAALPPLEAPSPWLELPVTGHSAAVVWIPLGATTARPVVVATHGAGGRAESHCNAWRQLVGDRAFIVCPRGYPMDPRAPETSGYFYTDHFMLGREVDRALAALFARFPEHADKGAPLYVGFSQGATMGALILPSHPARFARAVLIEGGYGGSQEWNLAMARAWKAQGGERVVLACGRAECSAKAEETAGYMRREALSARVVDAAGAGHTYGGAVWEGVARALPWLLSGDPRY